MLSSTVELLSIIIKLFRVLTKISYCLYRRSNAYETFCKKGSI